MSSPILPLLVILILAAATPAAEPAPFPGRTLADDLAGLQVRLVDGYAGAHPRLLFAAADQAALRRRAQDEPALWGRVATGSRLLERLPAAAAIRAGTAYWRIANLEAGALAWFVEGDAGARDQAVRWMVAHCREDTWGTDFRPNVDLVAAWYMYSIAIAFDILHDAIPADERRTIRDGLAAHARLIAADLAPGAARTAVAYDQNHLYTPAVALAAAALALDEEVPEARQWLLLAHAVMRRSRYALGEDGYYYEGYGYWVYAFRWHVRYAELMRRATGEGLHDLPAIREDWRFALHMRLPGPPGAFTVGDTGLWGGTVPRPGGGAEAGSGMLGAIASATRSPACKLVADLYAARGGDQDDPVAAFLAADPSLHPQELSATPPYQHFTDHDVVIWRSGWDPDATCCFFRCGPPLGHAAAAKLAQLGDWQMNAGHVHPDIGAFYLFAKGAFLATTTGYTAQKWTRDHNTLLLDGKGQGMDGEYHNEHGFPYANLDQARIDRCYLSAAYGFASGEFAAAYARGTTAVRLRRSVVMTRNWILLDDELSAPEPHALTWLCHADAPFAAVGDAFVARLPQAGLAVLPLLPADRAAKTGTTTVIGGSTLAETKPGRTGTIQRGYQISLDLAAPAARARFVTLLVPLAGADAPPVVGDADLAGDQARWRLRWPDGRQENVRFDRTWRSGTGAGPGPVDLRSH